MIDSTFRQALKAEAHHLTALVLIGQNGLTPAIIAEIDRVLNAHELVKIKWKDSDKEAREAALETLCLALSSEPIAHIGKHLVIWRENPEKKSEPQLILPKKPAKKPTKNAIAKRADTLSSRKKHYRCASPVMKQTKG